MPDDDDDDFYTYYSDDPDSYDPPSDDGETGEKSDASGQTNSVPTPPRPVHLIVNPIGHNRRYSLAIQLLSEQDNGFGIQATIKINEISKRGGRAAILQTDNNGFLLYETRSFFREEEHDFFIQVIGVAGLEVEFTLDRPE